MSEHVVVIGNIGAGKTTAVETLGAALGADVHVERYRDNPYLERFYADPPTWAAVNQLWFLGEVAAQHRAIAVNGGAAVQEQSIYTVFDVMTRYLVDIGAMSADDCALVERHHDVLAATLPAPSCLVRLRAPTDQLLARIEERGRGFEASVDAVHLEAIEARIESFATGWRRSPLIEVDSSEIDLRDGDHAVRLAHTIRAALDSAAAI